MSELQELQTQENDALRKYNTVNSKEENSVLFVNQQQNQFQILLLCLCLVMFITFKYLDMPSPVYNLFLTTGVFWIMIILMQTLFVNQRENQEENQFHILLLLLFLMMFEIFKNYYI